MAPGTRMALDARLGSPYPSRLDPAYRRCARWPNGSRRRRRAARHRPGIRRASTPVRTARGWPARHGGCRITEAGRAPVRHSCGLAAPQPPIAAVPSETDGPAARALCRVDRDKMLVHHNRSEGGPPQCCGGAAEARGARGGELQAGSFRPWAGNFMDRKEGGRARPARAFDGTSGPRPPPSLARPGNGGHLLRCKGGPPLHRLSHKVQHDVYTL